MAAPPRPPTTAPPTGAPTVEPTTAPLAAPMAPPVTARWPGVSPQAAVSSASIEARAARVAVRDMRISLKTLLTTGTARRSASCDAVTGLAQRPGERSAAAVALDQR